jgi:hypothetical protein
MMSPTAKVPFYEGAIRRGKNARKKRVIISRPVAIGRNLKSGGSHILGLIDALVALAPPTFLVSLSL